MQPTKMKYVILSNAMSIGLIASIACLVCNVPVSSSFAQPTPTSRIIYLFNSHLPDANETKLGIPTDLFAPSSITVNKGDTVIVHFYNTENEPHTFTIGAPYNIDKNVPGGQNATIVFKANYQGIFQYYCKYHLPTMQGQLIVQA